MHRRILPMIVVALLSLSQFAGAVGNADWDTIRLRWTFDSSLEGWDGIKNGLKPGTQPWHVAGSQSPWYGALAGDIQTNDPYIGHPSINSGSGYTGGENDYLWIKIAIQGKYGWKSLRVYYDNGSGFAQQRSRAVPIFCDGVYHNIFVFLGDLPGYAWYNIKKLRIDPIDADSNATDAQFIIGEISLRADQQAPDPPHFLSPNILVAVTTQSSFVFSWSEAVDQIALSSTPPDSNIKSSLIWLSSVSQNGPWNLLNGVEDNNRHTWLNGLVDNTTYYCRVKAVDRAGNVSNFSETVQVTKKPAGTSPGTPVNQEPPNESSVSTKDFLFNWSYSHAVPVSKYRLEIFSNATYSGSPLYATDVGCTGSNEPSELENPSSWTYEPGHSYYWHVCASDNSNPSIAGNWSASSGSAWYFTYSPASQETVTLLTPALGEVKTANPINFSWTSISGGSDYEIEVLNKSGTSIIDQKTGGSTSYSYGGFSEGTYTWHVAAKKGTAPFGLWSALGNFSLAFPGGKPVPPVLVTPSNDATVGAGSIRFSWLKPSGTTNQRIEIGTVNTQGDFPAQPTPVFSNTTTANQQDATLASGAYYWHVKAEKPTNIWSDWSETRKLSVSGSSGPTPPNRISPSDGASITQSSVTLTWGDTHQPEYWLLVTKNDGPFFDGSVAAATEKSFDGLDNATYKWRLKARNSGGIWGPYHSTDWTFTVSKPSPAAPPTLSQPEDKHISYDKTVLFKWNAVPAVTGYRFRIDKVGGGWWHDNSTIAASTTQEQVDLPLYGDYVWKVSAKNGADNWGDWSEPRTLYYRAPVNLTQNQDKQPTSLEPVNTATGAYTYSHQDLVIPGRGLPFEFARFCNSRATCSTVMGNKWKHSYLVSLEEQGDGTAIIHWANCTDDYYAPTGGGHYENAHFGFSGSLTKNPDNTFDFRTKGLITYHFDSAGRLLAMSDRNDNALTLTYSENHIDYITDTVGRIIDFQYDGNGNLWKVIDPLLRTLEFTYEPDGDLSTVKDARSGVMRYEYDAHHNITRITDPRGNYLIRNDYDANDRVTTQTTPRGHIWTYTYLPEGRTYETNPLGGVTTYEFNEFSWITSITDARGNTEKYSYDSEGNRTEVINARGNKTNYTYDARQNPLTVTDALSNTTSFEYNADDQITRITDALGRVTGFQYDVNGNLVKTTRPMGNIADFEYDTDGQLELVTDPLGNVTSYAYNSNGNRTGVTNALFETTRFEYDAVGRLTRTIEPNDADTLFTYDENDSLMTTTDQEDHQTSYTYDANNNRIALRNPRGFKTRFTYDASDLVQSVADAYSNTITYQYDALNHMTSMTDRRGKTFTFGYDPVGNRTRSTDATGTSTLYAYDAVGNLMGVRNGNCHWTYFTYDPLNRLKTTTDARGNVTTYDYDEAGRLVQMTDANDNVTTYEYDDLDRLVKVTDALYGTALYTYDLNGNRTSITDPNGHVTVLAYDELNRLVAETDPLGNAILYAYDKVGNLKTRTDARDNVTSYSYYLTHRLRRVDYPTGSPVTFTCDDNGNRTVMTDSAGATQYQYDNLDRITQVTDPFENIVGYGYDAGSNRTSIDYKVNTPGQKVVHYTFDANGRLKTLTDWAGHTFTYTYDAAGNIAELAYPNGCKEKRTYYANERLQKLWHEKPDGTKFIEYTYNYDGVGNIIGMDRREAVERGFAPEDTVYSYDQANEIQSANTDTFAFDEDGNQTAETTDEGTTDYTYDYENRLIQLDPPGSDLNQFAYNGVGDRLASVENGTTKQHLLDLNKPLTDVLADKDGSNNVRQYYVYGICLVARIDPTADNIFYYHHDHLGSIAAVTNNVAAVTASFTYDEFGAVVGSTGNEAGPWRFCGALGTQRSIDCIIYMRARFMSSYLGTFLSRDPVKKAFGTTQNLNLYSYVSNNPVFHYDPSGQCREIEFKENGAMKRNDLLTDKFRGPFINPNGSINFAALRNLPPDLRKSILNKILEDEATNSQTQRGIDEYAYQAQQQIIELAVSSVSFLASTNPVSAYFLAKHMSRATGVITATDVLVEITQLPAPLQAMETVMLVTHTVVTGLELIRNMNDPMRVFHLKGSTAFEMDSQKALTDITIYEVDKAFSLAGKIVSGLMGLSRRD